MKHFLLLIIVSLLIGSCSITKRRYNTGWHVEWHKKHNNSGEETASADPNNSVRLAEVPSQNSIPGSVSEEIPTTNESETSSPVQLAESASVKEDALSLSEDHPETTSSAQTTIPAKSVSEDDPDEKKDGLFPNSERVIPIPLAVILAILLVIVGSYISAAVSAVFLLLIALSGASFSAIAITVALLFGVITFTLVLLLVFHLFNRKETKYASKRERNLRYLLYAFCIASLFGGIAAIALATSLR
ncbi:MAG: hypothetical protein V4604_03580 [Bacteroidota bacterium]